MKDKNLSPTQAEKWDKGALSRRNFLQLGVLTTTTAGALATSGAISRFLVGDAMDAKEGEWVQVGELEGLPAGEVHKVAFSYRTTDAWRKVERTGALYTFSEDGSNYVALDATCTHLGCLVRWKKDDNHFACPCHEGLFSK